MEKMKRGPEQEMVINRSFGRRHQQTLFYMAAHLGLHFRYSLGIMASSRGLIVGLLCVTFANDYRPRFKAMMVVNDISFTTTTFVRTIKEAKNLAAKQAFEHFSESWGLLKKSNLQCFSPMNFSPSFIMRCFSFISKKCIDLDGNSIITRNELQFLYGEHLHRMECMSEEVVPFEDILCQIVDMIKPESADHLK